ncbi:sulfotransferase family 2 domain-containing protein [Marinobacter sp. AC-23]|uniref:sulfotransferase family 2 domain-containing protein n=1 Tax=Marinobacter sp. AC-23 TaxID=1879031 RepID=UPI0008DE2C3D|nr:sulfotransferase family 2 domain-containing protein [Marinobacter sp. AC-23]OHY82206.1 hypothetical protein BCA33_07900 [Marinobacter sp. AC-23]
MENHSFIKFVPGVYVIYLSVPKVASSSISYAMLNTQPTSQSGMSEHSPEGKALTNWRPAESPHPALPIFTFTRHPIEKFVSYYRDKFVRARGQGFELDHLKRLKFDPDMSLEEAVRHMMTIPVEKMEHHAQPQHRILIKNGRLIPDFVGKVEDISNDWPLISEVSLYDFSVEQKKNSTEGQGVPPDLVESVVSALAEYYSLDFELFGYEKPVSEDRTIKVVRPRYRLSNEQIKELKDEIVKRRTVFIRLADRLKEDPDFREGYLSSMKAEFNRFQVHANSKSSKLDPYVVDLMRRVKRMLMG